jgi:hypothetical protein
MRIGAARPLSISEEFAVVVTAREGCETDTMILLHPRIPFSPLCIGLWVDDSTRARAGRRRRRDRK